MKKKPLPKEFLKLARSITNKRARIVIEHILKHGYITTEELESDYGYNHPPRAARDVREAGIPLETFRIKDKEGRNIAAYRFGDVTQIQRNRLRGRLVFPKGLKERLYEQQNGKCSICSGILENRYLQIDHKVPYEVAGDEGIESFQVSEFMLLCASCNRAKSWSCEHCLNLKKRKGFQYLSPMLLGQSGKLPSHSAEVSPPNGPHLARRGNNNLREAEEPRQPKQNTSSRFRQKGIGEEHPNGLIPKGP